MRNFLREQFLESYSRELCVHLKPKTLKKLNEIPKVADLFAEARVGVYTCVNKAQRDNKSDSYPNGKPEIKLAFVVKGP